MLHVTPPNTRVSVFLHTNQALLCPSAMTWLRSLPEHTTVREAWEICTRPCWLLYYKYHTDWRALPWETAELSRQVAILVLGDSLESYELRAFNPIVDGHTALKYISGQKPTGDYAFRCSSISAASIAVARNSYCDYPYVASSLLYQMINDSGIEGVSVCNLIRKFINLEDAPPPSPKGEMK